MDYCPIKPTSEEELLTFSTRIYKIRKDTRMVNVFFFYIDDGRPTAISGKKCLHALRSIGSILIFWGIQEANRK